MTKKLFKFLALSCFLMSVSFFTFAKDAEAIDIQIKNPYNKQLEVAVVLFKDADRKWYVQGWYSVSPNSTRVLSFNNSTRMNKVYIHAYNSEASWGSQKRYTVIKEVFKYVAGQTCPSGSNRRQVGFDERYAENNGRVYWQP